MANDILWEANPPSLESSALQIQEQHLLSPSLAIQDPIMDTNYLSVPKDAFVQPSPAKPVNFEHVTPLTSKQFLHVVLEVQQAINKGVQPVRIAQGSSGSYFCRNRQGEVVAVFKPKDEEPYGILNPKWIKWMHRNLLPCCFGRECIIPNLGYVSEAAASLLDRRLGLGIVPRTEVVCLASPAFFYPLQDRWRHYLWKTPLPLKTGSFQVFLNGYQDASSFFRDGYAKRVDVLNGKHPLGWNEEQRRDFQRGFERLVVLDYLIRNTDRSLDNWMIQCNDNRGQSPSMPTSRSDSTLMASGDNESPNDGTESSFLLAKQRHESLSASPSLVRVAAIDNGLAFPTHHPDRIRSYPYSWTFLPIAHIPFSQDTAHAILPLLTSTSWWETTLDSLEALFRLDPDFKLKMWRKQRSVIRGQGYNLIEMLSRCLSDQQEAKESSTPWLLTRRPLMLVHEEHPADDDDEHSTSSICSDLDNVDDDHAVDVTSHLLASPSPCATTATWSRSSTNSFVKWQKKELLRSKRRLETLKQRACLSSW